MIKFSTLKLITRPNGTIHVVCPKNNKMCSNCPVAHENFCRIYTGYTPSAKHDITSCADRLLYYRSLLSRKLEALL